MTMQLQHAVQNKETQANDTIEKIIENYIVMEKVIVSELKYGVKHNLTTGYFRETVWKRMFESIVPRKFAIDQSVFIIDSYGQVSKEVDLAIFDEQYTPYIFKYGNIKYIPIEAVAVVVQCKSTNTDTNSLDNWVKSIESLNTSNKSIVRTMPGLQVGWKSDKTPSQTATRPIKILCHTNAGDYNSSHDALFDFIIQVSEEAEKLVVRVPKEKDSLLNWCDDLNHAQDPKQNDNSEQPEETSDLPNLECYRIKCNEKNEELSLLSLTFQLNQLLMLINNPMFFPHIAYVEMFIKNFKEMKPSKI